ncbi:SIR2 family protein [Comamonas aquatica]|uniref:SIR2 family protein n=1 Tax=Comamonas aquatica TaxID=225991 RepID=UPI002447AE28|nr:SIR2 family protein [Comamonas aquatica]MDH1901998.1 SIR2 family protein [Comamonas aquatica]
MKTLNILTGAGVNIAVSKQNPEIEDLIGFTYQSISKSVYEDLEEKWRNIFNPESFDYILGALITMSSVIDKTKEELNKYGVDLEAFGELFHQSALRAAIEESYKKIEDELLIESNQLVEVIRFYNPSIESLRENFEKINYFTLNFDGVFDHVLYGERFSRGGVVTDSWLDGEFTNRFDDRKFRVCHLHGDIRYKPHKVSGRAPSKRLWPVLVVGDILVKKSLIAGNDALMSYYKYYKNQFSSINKDASLLIAGFGFRDEDQHISSKVKTAIKDEFFKEVFIYDAVDHLKDDEDYLGKYTFIDAKNTGLSEVLGSLR